MTTPTDNTWAPAHWHLDTSEQGTDLLSIQAPCVASPDLRGNLSIIDAEGQTTRDFSEATDCTQQLTSHSCTGHSNSTCYSLLSAGTWCLRYNMSPAKKGDQLLISVFQCNIQVTILTPITVKQKDGVPGHSSIFSHCYSAPHYFANTWSSPQSLQRWHSGNVSWETHYGKPLHIPSFILGKWAKMPVSLNSF